MHKIGFLLLKFLSFRSIFVFTYSSLLLFFCVVLFSSTCRSLVWSPFFNIVAWFCLILLPSFNILRPQCLLVSSLISIRIWMWNRPVFCITLSISFYIDLILDIQEIAPGSRYVTLEDFGSFVWVVGTWSCVVSVFPDLPPSFSSLHFDHSHVTAIPGCLNSQRRCSAD